MTDNRTWSSLAEMQRAEAVLLQGNRHFAWQKEDGDYYPCRDLAQLQQFAQDIFTGRRTVGFYAITPEETTGWGCMDYDSHGNVGAKRQEESARVAYSSLVTKCDEAWLEQSSTGRYHVWGIWRRQQPAADVRSLLFDIDGNCREVFPKQAEHKNGSKEMGSLVRLPGRHQLKGTWSRFIARQGHVDPADADNGTTGKFRKANEADHFLALYARVTDGIVITGPGERFKAMQLIGARLKGRTLNEAVAEKVHERFYNANRQHIRTSFEDSRIKFLRWFRKAAPCRTTFPIVQPAPSQAALISALPKVKDVRRDYLEQVVRMCLSAERHAAAQQEETFFLSLYYIARELGVSVSSAAAIRSACRKLEVIKLVKAYRYTEGLADEYVLGKQWSTCNHPAVEDGCRPYRMVTGEQEQTVKNGYKSCSDTVATPHSSQPEKPTGDKTP